MKMKTEYAGALRIETTIMKVMEPKTNSKASSAKDVCLFCNDMKDAAQEMFVVLCLNTRNRIIDRVLVSLGIQDASLVHPREVFRPAILKSAAAVIIVHNHPSGDATPSAEDIRITRQLIQAGQIIGIKVLDHVIIGRPDADTKGYVSFRDNGLVEFE